MRHYCATCGCTDPYYICRYCPISICKQCPLTNGPNPDATKSSMEDSKFFHIANRQANGSVISYFACRLAGPPVYSLVEITFPPSGSGKNACKTCVRSDNGNLGKSVIDHIKKLLTN